jgi:hypothetical protein
VAAQHVLQCFIGVKQQQLLQRAEYYNEGLIIYMSLNFYKLMSNVREVQGKVKTFTIRVLYFSVYHQIQTYVK